MTPTPAQNGTTPVTARLSDGVLVCIVLLVGLMAGAASFSHVHDWTIENSPANTDDWFGWANAVISELIPTASLIEIARRRRRNPAAKVGYPMFLLVVAVGISLTAQLAVAKPTAFGWMVSALPALAFFALSKLVFSTTANRPATNPVSAPMPATVPASSSDTAQETVRPAAANKTRATRPAKTTPAKKAPARQTPAKKTTAPATPEPTPAATPTGPTTAPAAPSDPRYSEPLLATARTIVAAHRDDHGEDIRPNQLAARLRVPTPDAVDILTQLTNNSIAANTAPHNGSTVGANL